MGSTPCLIMLVRTDGQAGALLFSVFIVYRTQYATHGREVRRWHTVSAKTLYTGKLQSPCPVFLQKMRTLYIYIYENVDWPEGQNIPPG